MSAAGSINSLNGFLEIVVCDFFCLNFHSLFTEDALPASRSQCRLDPSGQVSPYFRGPSRHPKFFLVGSRTAGLTHPSL